VRISDRARGARCRAKAAVDDGGLAASARAARELYFLLLVPPL
jgi:hypothetical protein